jgi:eukaryotic-like serine/threonine-protein kinase
MIKEPSSVQAREMVHTHAVLEQGRYEHVRTLGSGSMGVVDLVFDRVRQQSVARKRVVSPNGTSLSRFKSEFRVLESLSHPNLVRVYDLVDDVDGLMFTMEWIDGQHLPDFCRTPAGELDEARCWHVLPQLFHALAHLHGLGIVHRDIKPQNILVQADGRVKLLDFGVSALLTTKDDVSHQLIGTPTYMSPEQIRGEAPSCANDAYGLGVLLYEILSGKPPFSGTRAEVLEAHLNREASPLSCSNGCSELAVACHRLLAKQAGQRPSTLQLVEQFCSHIGRAAPLPRSPTLVGRDDLLDQLRLWLARGAPSIGLVGPSGCGKSRMLDWLGERAQELGWLVFKSRARSAESVAFNAIDGIVDDLARALRSRASQRDVEIASTAFPVLAQGRRATNITRERIRAKLFGSVAAPLPLSRADIFDALLRLIAEIGADDAGTLLLIDDVQWADVDSRLLLTHLVAQRCGRVRVAVALRDDLGALSNPDWLRRQAIDLLQLEPLGIPEIAAIVRQATAAMGTRVDEPTSLAAAKLCRGRPFLAEVAAHSLVAGGGGDPVDAIIRLDSVSATGLRMLAMLVAADGWLALDDLVDTLGHTAGELRDTVWYLARIGLIREGRSDAGNAAYDLYHDGVREALSKSLAEEEIIVAHGVLAEWLQANAGACSRIARHLVGAKRMPEAMPFALAAAREAHEQRAYALEAEMLLLALTLQPADENNLREKRAAALEACGRYADAAYEWRVLRKSQGSPGNRYAMAEAHALIAADRPNAGYRLLDETLKLDSSCRSFLRRVADVSSLARFALGPAATKRSTRPESTSGPDFERLFGTGILLAFANPYQGIVFLQGVSVRLPASAVEQRARVHYLFAILALAGSNSKSVRLAEAYRRSAARLIGQRQAAPETLAVVQFLDGVGSLRAGRWGAAVDSLSRAATAYEASTGTTEITFCRSFRTMAHVYRQDLLQIRKDVEWFTQHATERDGAIINAHVRLVTGYVQFLQGQFSESFDSINGIANHFSSERPNIQRAGALLYRHIADIFCSDPWTARVDFSRALRNAAYFRLLPSMYGGPFAQVGALLEVNALRTGDRRARPERVEHFARWMDRSPPLVAGAASRARAYLEDWRGNRALAIGYLLRAEQQAAGFQRQIDIQVARFQRGLRVGGAEGRDLCSSAVAVTESLGASASVLAEDAGFR